MMLSHSFDSDLKVMNGNNNITEDMIVRREIQTEDAVVISNSSNADTDHYRSHVEDFSLDHIKIVERKPFLFCRIVTSFPVTSFIVGVLGHLVIVTITGLLLAMDNDVFPTNFETLPMELRDSPWLARYYAFNQRNSYNGKVYRFVEGDFLPFWTRGLSIDGLTLIYDTKGENIFTPFYLRKIQELEIKLNNIPGYIDACQLDKNRDCIRPISVIRYFDGSMAHIDPVFNDSSFNNIPIVLNRALSLNKTKLQLQYFLSKDFQLINSTVLTSLTRTYMPLGWPVKKDFDIASGRKLLEVELVTKIQPILDDAIRGVNDMDISYFSILLMSHDVKKQALKDIYLAVGSAMFIFFYMWLHTSSLWITSWAVISILSSFLATNLIYRYILGFRYFGFFHIISLFIILGIGADDLFVFYDCWSASAFLQFSTLAHRLSFAYRTSSLSILVTSVTTMAAFAATSLSPLLATKSFGIFSAVLVIIDYIYVVLFFPIVVIFYHVKIKKVCPNCCKIKATMDSDGLHERIIENDFCQTDEVQIKTKKKPSLLVRFIGRKYFSFVTSKMKWVLMGASTIVFIFLTISCFRLQPDNEQVRLFKKSHNYGKARSHLANSFKPNDVQNPTTLSIIWGVQEPDLSSCHFSDISCRGTPRFDDSFNPNPVESQIAFQRFCDRIYNLSKEEMTKLKIKRHPLHHKPEMSCFTRNLNQFLMRDTLLTGIESELPWDSAKAYKFIKYRSPEFYNISALNFSTAPLLDIALNYWMYNRYMMNQTEDYRRFNTLIGEQEGPNTVVIGQSPGVKIGNRIKHLCVEVNLTIDPVSIGFEEGIPIVNAWEDFMIEQKSMMPDGLKGGFQVALDIWHWFHVQKALYDNAISGILFGLLVTSLIILLSTQNVITSLMASLTISMVTVCVLGVISLMGWKLGVLVSLNMCLVVGLSVDYVVHMAEGYTMSKHKDRLSRVRDALETMGTSVYSGAVTTLGASIFMLFAQIIFFYQFGIFMFFTLGFSFIFSFGFFIPLLATFGPENDTGHIRQMVKKRISLIKRR